MSTSANTTSRSTAARSATAKRNGGSGRGTAKPAARSRRAASAASSRSAGASSRSASTRAASGSKRRAPAQANRIETVGSYAERAVLIPVGAALVARDRLLAGVGELPRRPADANAKARAQLRRFERRGTSARKRIEREARRTRVRLERELRRRRRSLDRAVSDLDSRRGSLARSLTGQVDEASTHFERTVQARVKDATSLASKVQDRFLDLL